MPWVNIYAFTLAKRLSYACGRSALCVWVINEWMSYAISGETKNKERLCLSKWIKQTGKYQWTNQSVRKENQYTLLLHRRFCCATAWVIKSKRVEKTSTHFSFIVNVCVVRIALMWPSEWTRNQRRKTRIHFSLLINASVHIYIPHTIKCVKQNSNIGEDHSTHLCSHQHLTIICNRSSVGRNEKDAKQVSVCPLTTNDSVIRICLMGAIECMKSTIEKIRKPAHSSTPLPICGTYPFSNHQGNRESHLQRSVSPTLCLKYTAHKFLAAVWVHCAPKVSYYLSTKL